MSLTDDFSFMLLIYFVSFMITHMKFSFQLYLLYKVYLNHESTSCISEISWRFQLKNSCTQGEWKKPTKQPKPKPFWNLSWKSKPFDCLVTGLGYSLRVLRQLRVRYFWGHGYLWWVTSVSSCLLVSCDFFIMS